MHPFSLALLRRSVMGLSFGHRLDSLDSVNFVFPPGATSQNVPQRSSLTCGQPTGLQWTLPQLHHGTGLKRAMQQLCKCPPGDCKESYLTRTGLNSAL